MLAASCALICACKHQPVHLPSLQLCKQSLHQLPVIGHAMQHACLSTDLHGKLKRFHKHLRPWYPQYSACLACTVNMPSSSCICAMPHAEPHSEHPHSTRRAAVQVRAHAGEGAPCLLHGGSCMHGMHIWDHSLAHVSGIRRLQPLQ